MIDDPTKVLIAAALSTAKPVVELWCRWADSLVGPSFSVAGGMLGDWLYSRRVAQQIRLILKLRAQLEASGVDIKPGTLPPGFLASVLEDAGRAESEDIHDLFAKLLAAAVSDDVLQHPMFRNAVAQMNADEVRIVAGLQSADHDHYAYGVVSGHVWNMREPDDETGAWVPDLPGVTLSAPGASHIYMANLERLGIINPSTGFDQGFPPDHIIDAEQMQREIKAMRQDGHAENWVQRKVKLTPAGERLAVIAAGQLAKAEGLPDPP